MKAKLPIKVLPIGRREGQLAKLGEQILNTLKKTALPLSMGIMPELE
jgi:hypothetical protein